ncbi:MAG TPA: trigger factor [Gemmataceae bacterium]|nr:trigger factor [Gemmataceae bacterium]
MTDETRPDESGIPPATAETPPAEGAATATDEEGKESEPAKLHQSVEIKDVGPCKKHIKVTIERQDIDDRFGEKFSELVSDANVSGFRPGKAPRRIIERRFQREVGDQVKTEVLLASLQQLAEDHDIAPLSQPDLDPAAIEMPKQGPLVYEFEVEVRPQFDLPEYKGLKLKKLVHVFSDEEVAQEERRILAPHGQVVPKPEGNAQIGDILTVDVTTRDGYREISTIKEAQFRIDKRLAFKDAVAPRFAEQVQGANAGDVRTVDIEVSTAAADASLRGKTVQASVDIKDVKTLRPPELTHEFLHLFGVHSADELHELIRALLQRRLEYTQRQSAREQVLAQIAAASTWELPQDLLMRQARKAMARRIMEMRSDGISEEEIAQRQRLMQQDVLRSTELALKEHFVLQKIAEKEKIEINEDDLNEEIERLAEQADESPRRVRARLEKEDMLDALAAEMIERKALDLILDSAEWEEAPLKEEAPAVSTVEAQTVPGEMHDPAAEPSAAESEPETPAAS